MYTLGIDLHKRSSVWVLIDDAYEEMWKSSVPAHPDHITTALETMPVPCREVRVALEPVCGWRWVRDRLRAAGCAVHVAHPQKVRLIAQSKQKHDEVDALVLAKLLQAGYFPETHVVREETYRLRLLLRERAHLVKLRTGVKNRLHGVATTQGLHTIAGGNPLGSRGKQGILAGDNDILKAHHTLIQEFDRRIAQFDRACLRASKAEPLTHLLMTMPGIGVITALTIVAEVEDFARFPSAKQLTAFAGLVPRQRSSGTTRRFGSITNQGSKILRTAMVEAAMRIREKSAPELYQFVARLAPRCGAKKARIALARKMLAIIWRMGTTNNPYTSTTRPASPCNTNVSELDTAAGS